MATFLNAFWAERLERAADPRCAPRCLAFAVWTAGSMALTSLTRSGWRWSGTGKSGTTHAPAPTSIATAHGRHTSIERSSSCRDDCSHPSSPLEAIGVRRAHANGHYLRLAGGTTLCNLREVSRFNTVISDGATTTTFEYKFC